MKRRVVRPLADVPAQVDPPEERAVELVGFEFRFAGRAAAGVVARPHLLLEHDLEFAVAVEIAHRGIVRRMPGQGAAAGRKDTAKRARWPAA